MRVVLVINLLVVTCVLLSESATISDSALRNQELLIYKEQIRILYQLVAKECSVETKFRRDDGAALADLEVQKLHYNDLLKRLSKCRQINLTRTLKTTSTKTKPTTTKPTTLQPLPSPCLSATNLTESWRMDHVGKNLMAGGPNAYNGRACDLRQSLQWFRFTGAAGKNRVFY